MAKTSKKSAILSQFAIFGNSTLHVAYNETKLIRLSLIFSHISFCSCYTTELLG